MRLKEVLREEMSQSFSCCVNSQSQGFLGWQHAAGAQFGRLMDLCLEADRVQELLGSIQ